jgi:ABC-type transport system involved in cytochrome bd biosynthesis fused ATPase/permease subunit
VVLEEVQVHHLEVEEDKIKTAINYLKGVGGLILIILLGILAIIFFAVFNMAYAAALFVLAIVTILILPYYFGRQDQPEKKGNYRLKKIK